MTIKVIDDRVCCVEGCGEPTVARGYCARHYKQFRRYGKILEKAEPKRNQICEIDGCNQPTYSRGMCNSHYRKYLRGTLEKDNICRVEGCSNPVHARRLCQNHYRIALRKLKQLKQKENENVLLDDN